MDKWTDIQAKLKALKAEQSRVQAALAKVSLAALVQSKGGVCKDCEDGDYLIRVPGMMRSVRLSIQGYNKIEREMRDNELTRTGKSYLLHGLKMQRI